MPGDGERDEHEEQRPDGDQEHDREDGDTLGHEIPVAVERAGEIEPEHSRASIGAERLRSDQRGEERERASGDERVVAVGDQVVDGEILEDHREGHRDESGKKGDGERDRGQHLVATTSPEPQHPPCGEDGQRRDRPSRAFPPALVAAIAEVEEPRAPGFGAHVPAPR